MKIVVAELNKYHAETFPIYENLLPSFFKQTDAAWFYYQLPTTRYRRTIAHPQVRSIICKWKYYLARKLRLLVPVFTRQVQRIVDATKAEVVVFNSIEPEPHQRVFKAVNAPKKIALIHNPATFFPHEKRGNEYFFVLSPIVFDHFRATLPLDGYLLPYFRPYSEGTFQKRGGKTLVGIQGLVDFDRRDYAFLTQVAQKLRAEGTKTVLFNIVGSNNRKDGKKFREMIRTAQLESYFKFHEYLDDRAFFSEIAKCDVLMPLLGLRHEVYLREKITATLSHSVAYNKPMVLSRGNAEAWKLDGRTQYIYDDIDGCVDVLRHIPALSEKKERLEQWRRKQIDINRKFLFEHNFPASG